MNRTVTLLYLEDDPLDVQLLRETLATDGLDFELVLVDTRRDYIKALKDASVDLILSDFRLPGFDGFDSLLLAHKYRPDTPFIYVSGAIGEEQAIELLKQGATDYILKNRLNRLSSAMTRALDEAEEQRQRKKADRELQESNVRLTSVLESVTGLLERIFENKHVLIMHLDAQGTILRVNRAYARAKHHDESFFAGKKYLDLYPDSEMEHLFRAVLESGEPYVAKEKTPAPFGAESGRETYWDWSLQPVKNERGSVEGLLLCLLDVTRRKQAQKARVLTERRYRDLVENVDSIIMRWKSDGTITFANRFACQFFGYKPGELNGSNVIGTIFPVPGDADMPRWPSAEEIELHPGQHNISESENVRQDGRRVWIRWTYRMLRDASGKASGILCVGTDITDRKQKELEMGRVQQNLRDFARKMGTTLHGRAASPGLAEGNAMIYVSPESEMPLSSSIEKSEVDSEVERFDRALNVSITELETIREQIMSHIAGEEIAILETHLMMLKDASFADKCRERVRKDLIKVEHAVAAEIRDLDQMFKGMEREYMSERSADVRDIGRRVLWNLKAGGESPYGGLKSLPPGTILVAEQLLPSDTLQLDRANVVAFVTERGGTASHAAILARAMAIPAVCDVKAAASFLATGDHLLVDAESGTVTVAPTKRQMARFAVRKAGYIVNIPEPRNGNTQHCETKDGVEIGLLANIGRTDEVYLAKEYRVNGVGLFRSEFLFMEVDKPPDLKTQCEAYSEAAAAMHPSLVTIRTMDLGGDKIPHFSASSSDLVLQTGKRGLAYSLTEKTMFRTQLQAILGAAKRGNVRIMFPMVTGVADFLEARRLVDELTDAEAGLKKIPVGAMIETPAAVFSIRDILEIADFVSIGTNDLAQFVLTIDRTSSDFQGVLSFLHPSVLRATYQVVQAAREYGVDLSVCGEAASDPAAAILLVGMGVRNLSMNPFQASRVCQSLQQITIDQAESAVKDVLAVATSKDVQEIIKAVRSEV